MNKVVLFAIPHLYGGGAERVVSLWASYLAQTLSCSVHILVSGRVPNEYAIDERVTISSISSTYEDYDKLSILTKIRKRRSLIKQIKPDYIISFLPHIQIQTFIATLGIEVKRIETIRVSPWVLNLKNLSKILFNLCLSTSYKVILQTNEQKEFFHRLIQDKCIVIPNPIDDNYKRLSEKQQSQVVEHFVAAGRIVPQKNYSMMIRAFTLVCKEYPKISLDIFGGGENAELDKLTHLIEQLGMTNNIRLRGRSNKIIDEYLSHDVFLMTSDYEGMPNALLEAMASGMICLTTDCKTGPKDMIIHGESGFLLPVNDVQAFADAIRNVIQMTQTERQKIGECARTWIMSMCSSETTTKSLLSIFDN